MGLCICFFYWWVGVIQILWVSCAGFSDSWLLVFRGYCNFVLDLVLCVVYCGFSVVVGLIVFGITVFSGLLF